MNSPSKRFVYYLQSAVDRDQRYSGLTSDVAARLSAHNAGNRCTRRSTGHGFFSPPSSSLKKRARPRSHGTCNQAPAERSRDAISVKAAAANTRRAVFVCRRIGSFRFRSVRSSRWRSAAVAAFVLVAFWALAATAWMPAIGMGGLLYPSRHHVRQLPPEGCEGAMFDGARVRLAGWRCHATSERRATLVYLHGIADNRTSAINVVRRFGPRGFDVVAYDSRAHGESDGDVCTYGFFEKDDLRRVLDSLDPGPVVLMGSSLGAAVALQEAADDRRVTVVVAAETFSDLRTIARERAPFFFTSSIINRAFRLAEERAHFTVDQVSPARSAQKIVAPVLLVHGASDVDTPPAHSERVFAALTGVKKLFLVPAAQHNGSLRGDVWDIVERWVDAALRGHEPTPPDY
jgi:uncharacterized protein